MVSSAMAQTAKPHNTARTYVLSIKRFFVSMFLGSSPAKSCRGRWNRLWGSLRRFEHEVVFSCPPWEAAYTGRPLSFAFYSFFLFRCVRFQVLERVALAYPRALFFPLLMTKASAARRGGAAGGGGGGTESANDGDRRLSKLTGLTADPSGEAFAEVGQRTTCLGRVNVPFWDRIRQCAKRDQDTGVRL